MRIMIVGGQDFDNYQELMRNMAIVIEDAYDSAPEDHRLTFVHTGRNGAENMVSEFLGKTEKYLRQKGYSVREEVVRIKGRTDPEEKLTRDYDIITSGIDSAVIFVKGTSKRAEYCARLLKEFNVPVKYVRTH